MPKPQIKTIAISNVFCRCMNFVNAGDIEKGHCHSYDHGTLVANGQILVEMLDDNDAVINKKIFVAPSFVFIRKDKRHRLTALVDNSIAVCIHALRDIDENIIPPDTLVEEKWFADTMWDSNHVDDHINPFFARHHKIEIGGLSLPSLKNKGE